MKLLNQLVFNFALHTKLTLMMKQQNKLMPCPSAALGFFIGLILYDHRRAIAWSKLISSHRQCEKKKQEKKISIQITLLLGPANDEHGLRIQSTHLSDSNSFCPLVLNMLG